MGVLTIVLGDEPIDGEEARFPLVNTALIVTNIIVFLVGVTAPFLLVPGATSYAEVIAELGMIPALVVAGEKLYTIFTSMFLHGSLAHLFGNMLYLYVFGDNIENVMGRWKYLLFYLSSGIVATAFHIASIMFMPQDALISAALQSANPWMIPAVGASGAISGVLAAYLILFPVNSIRLAPIWFPFVAIPIPASVYILFWFLYQVFMGLAVSISGVNAGVAFWAHVGGFLGGAALTPLLARKRERKRAYRLVVESFTAA